MADPEIDADKPNPLMRMTGRRKTYGDAVQSSGAG